MDSLLSIIVPVYNSKEHLECCIDSILGQSYSNIELIIIDDGSTDGSSEICDYYAQKDSRVVVVHKKNGGASSARNAGLEIANGEYVAFIDSDDYCEYNMFEMLMATAYCMHADIVACGGNILTEDIDVTVPSWLKRTLSPKFAVSNIFSSRIFSVRGLLPFLWNKIYKKSVIDSLGIVFNTDLKIGEDTVFLKTLFPVAQRIITIPDELYNYRYARAESLGQQNKEEYILGLRHIEVIGALASAWRDMDLLSEQYKHFMKWSLGYVFWQIEHLQSFELASAFLRIWDSYGLLDNISVLSKEEKQRLIKIKEYAEEDEEKRSKLLNRRGRIAQIKEMIRSHRLTYDLFELYWHWRYRGLKSAIKSAKSILNEYKNIIIRDGIVFYYYAILRMLRVPFAYEPYKDIAQVKDCHKNESCFIVAPGPSLSLDDLDALRGINCISLNSTISLMSYSNWRPTYYVLFDGRAYRKIKREEGSFNVDTFPLKKAFINAHLKKTMEKEVDISKIIFVPYCNGGNSEEKHVLHLRYTDNLMWGYYDLATVTNAAIHIAQYMGFRKIYLLGVDCDYSQEKQYFNGSKNNNIHSSSQMVFVQNRMFKAYAYMKKQMDKRGIEVYNATRGGALEVFPRICFEDAVAEIKNEALGKN